MREVEILIVGGGVAGTTAAETYRAGGGSGEVVIVSDERHPLYSRVLLPHAVKGKISPDAAFLKQTEWYAEKGVELAAGRSVTRVDYARRVATLDDGAELSYRKLGIAAGANPRAWDVPGGEDALRLQTYDDAASVAEAVRPGSRLAIVGSGFIGLEFAAIAVAKGANAVILNRGPRFWTSMPGGPWGSLRGVSKISACISGPLCPIPMPVVQDGGDMHGETLVWPIAPLHPR